MTRPRSRRRWSPLAAATLALALAGTLLPLLYLVSVSLMNQGQVNSGLLVPPEPAFGNYADALAGGTLLPGLLNSLVAAIAGSLITLAIALPAAWAMARSGTGGSLLAGTILSPWLLPPIVAVLPLFVLLRQLGLNNTLPGLVLIYAFANAGVAIWLLEGFVRRIPPELDEAAQLDGAGPLRILLRVAAPLLSPGLVAVGVIVAVLNYHEFVLASFLTQSPQAQTVTVVLANFLGERVQNFGKIAAASIIAVLPVFAGAVFLQRWLVAGLTSGGVK